MSVTLQQSCTLVPGIPKSATGSGGLTLPAHAENSGRAAAEVPGTSHSAASHLGEGRIAKELVHFHDEESVLVYGWARRGPREFTLAVEWPGSTSGRRPDPVLAAQTVRQCGLAISHAEFGVPLDHQSLLWDLNYSIAPTLPAEGNGSLRLTVDLRCSPAKNGRGGSLIGGETMDFTVRQGSHAVIRAHSRSAWISPDVYRRLRGPYLSPGGGGWGAWEVPPPVPAASVGCGSAAEVVLAATDRPGTWLLRNDVANKTMFDHPVDHVPGLSLLGAAAQAAQAAVSPAVLVPADVTTSFSRYVEFDAPCRLSAVVRPAGAVSTGDVAGGAGASGASGSTLVEVVGEQNGEAAFRIGLWGPLN
ncbi:A-factor biosynthesis protein [Streptomyces sp. SCA3-4]|uniref:ScbA/BarX family gamma-butyrolactone biosynthesis protein n=1 Tax=Streptomyces sichuanensis TaxID=2871810 RepID=UPI001CE2EB9F|nr:ScbA/BarX family gamma-butyrolactone biosynthesis protein [Streptomyces sichuanensis]MCA6092261.1 A-factor biosynthesis protein [Streptomyces sichuanensis]